MDTDKLDYFFKSSDVSEEDMIVEINQEYTPLNKVDYFVDKDCKIPMSFSQIRDVEEGIRWYSYYHPELPPDIIPMLSKYQFGNLPIKHNRHSRNKKTIKNTGITISNELITLNFDD